MIYEREFLHTSANLHIHVPAVKYKELAEDEKSEESSRIRERILAARVHFLAADRNCGHPLNWNTGCPRLSE
jgi:hypothetical protein